MSNVSSSAAGDSPAAASGPLEPPTFQLPDDVGLPNSRWEVWTVRLPDDVSLADLDGSITTVVGSTSTPIETSDGRTFVLQRGDPCENACFRILQPASKVDRRHTAEDSSDDDSDSSDHDNDSKTYYNPSPVTFARHWNVVSYLPPLVETELAPSLDQAPAPSRQTVLRHAYAPVPQRTGLKRRWKPIGGFSHPPTGVESHTSKEERLSRSPDVQLIQATAPLTAKAATKSYDELLPSTGGQAPGQATAAPDPETSTAEHDKATKRLAKKAKKDAKKAKKAQRHSRDKY